MRFFLQIARLKLRNNVAYFCFCELNASMLFTPGIMGIIAPGKVISWFNLTCETGVQRLDIFDSFFLAFQLIAAVGSRIDIDGAAADDDYDNQITFAKGADGERCVIIFFQLLRTANGRHGVDDVDGEVSSDFFDFICDINNLLVAVVLPCLTVSVFESIKGKLLLPDFEAFNFVFARLIIYLTNSIEEDANISNTFFLFICLIYL